MMPSSFPSLSSAIVVRGGLEDGRGSPAPSLAVALGRVGSATHLGNTLELALMARALVSQPPGCESMRAVPVSHRLQE